MSISGQTEKIVMFARKNPAPRVSKAYKFATRDELLKVKYVIASMGILTSQQAVDIVRSLSPAARRVLLFFAALNRSLGHGYRGTAAPQADLAKAIDNVSDVGCSLSTLKRGISSLIDAGLITKTYVHLYDRNGQVVRYQRALGEWETLKVCNYTLTPSALELWAKQKKDRSNKTVVKCHTQAKKSDNNKISSYPLDSQRILIKSNIVSKPQVFLNDRMSTANASLAVSMQPAKVKSDCTRGHGIAKSYQNGAIDNNNHSKEKGRSTGKIHDRPTKGVNPSFKLKIPGKLADDYSKRKYSILKFIFFALKNFSRNEASRLYEIALHDLTLQRSTRSKCVDWPRIFNIFSGLTQRKKFLLWKTEILPGLKSAHLTPAPDIEAIHKFIKIINGENNRRAAKNIKNKEIAPEIVPDINIFETKSDDKIRLKNYISQLETETDPAKQTLLVSAIKILQKKIFFV
jgi:hypothetical protein